MAHMSGGSSPSSGADLANKGLRVLLLYERGAAGSTAVDQARELIQAHDGRLTVVTLAPRDTRVRGTGVSARDYNDAVRDNAQRELGEARRLFGSLAERIVFEVVSEGAGYRLDRLRRSVRPRPMSKNPNAATAVTFKPVNGSVAPLEAGTVCDGVVVVAPEVGVVAGLGVCEAAGVVTAARTITVPCMNGWIWQKYVYVPGLVKVCEAVAPFFRTPVLKLPSLAVAV
jgi:hypothetical protein